MNDASAPGRRAPGIPGRLRLFLTLGLALLLGPLSSPAQGIPVAPESPAAIPAERFFQYPTVLQAVMSPSGIRLAPTTAVGAQRVGLMVIKLTGRIEAHSVTSQRDENIASFHWVGDDRIVFTVTDLQEGSGEDDRFAPGLFFLKADGTELHQLVQRRGELHVAATGSLNRRLEWNHIFLHAPAP